jgi:hypothetical protein
MIPTSREGDSAVILHTPDQRSGALWEPETAEETEEKEPMLGNMEWARRLDVIESRQKRIEELLLEVVSGMRRGQGQGQIDGKRVT